MKEYILSTNAKVDDINQALLKIGHLIKRSAYLDTSFDQQKFYNYVYKIFKLEPALARTSESKSVEIQNFIGFILDFDKIIFNYEAREDKFEESYEKLTSLRNRENNFYFNGFIRNELACRRIIKSSQFINEELKKVINILEVFKNEDVAVRNEFNMIKNTTDTAKKTVLTNKLNVLQERITEKTLIKKELKASLLNDNTKLENHERDKYNAVASYKENHKHIQVTENQMLTITKGLDNLFTMDITNCFVKYHLLVSDFIDVHNLNIIYREVILKLTKILNSHGVSFTNDTISTCILNHNYFDSCYHNNLSYAATKGKDIYEYEKINSTFYVKHKSFKYLYIMYNQVLSYNSLMNNLVDLENHILEDAIRLKDKTVYLPLVNKYYKIACLLYYFMYGENITSNITLTSQGLYEKGGIASNPHFYQISFDLSKYNNGKDKTFAELKESYWKVIGTLYKAVAHKSFKRLNINSTTINSIERNILDYSDNFTPIEKSYTDTFLIHDRINKRANKNKKK